MNPRTDLDIKQDAAIIEAWLREPSYNLFQRELESLKAASISMAAHDPWSAQVAGLRANALDDLTNAFQEIIDAKDNIVSAQIEAANQPKSSQGMLDQVRPRQSPQAT